MLVNLLLCILLKILKEDYIMAIATVYATLILKGKKNFSEVPERIKDQVRQVLIDLEAPEELYTETEE